MLVSVKPQYTFVHCCKIFFSPLAISAACPPGGAVLPAFLAIAASVTAVLAQSQVLSFPALTLQAMGEV